MTRNDARLLFNEQRYGLPAKWLLLAIGALSLLISGWAGYTRQPLQFAGWVVGAYAFVTAILTLFFATRRQPLQRTFPYWLSQGVDVVAVTALLAVGDGLASPLYLLYPLLALKSLIYTPDIGGMIWLPFFYGPFYVLALWLAQGNLAFLADPLFLGRYLLLLLLIIASTLATWALAIRLSEVDRLRSILDARSQDLAAQTRTLQRTATDLGDRLLELRSLQEVAKALSATLYLNETLHTIADRLSSVAGSPHCAVALLDEEQNALIGPVLPAGSPPFSPRLLPLDGSPAIEDVMRSGRSQVLSLSQEEAEARGGVGQLARFWRVQALEITPMVARGRPIGALLVGLEDQAGSDRRPRSLVDSFAYFAATAVENARLYSDMAEKSRELEAMLAGIGDGVLVVDTNGALVLMNPVAERILGMDAPARPGQTLRELVSLENLADLLDETAIAGQVLIRELPIASAGLSSDGQSRTFQALAAPVYRASESGEELGGVVTVLRDITAQKELERMKSNFLSVVSHELKTPLHSIKGFVEIILMGKTGPVSDLQRDFLGTVQEQTGHLQRLIEDLLEFSRLESGQIRLRPVLLSPVDLVESVVDKLSPLAANKQVAIRIEVPSSFPEIEADAMRLEQVLTNLLENAIKFTDSGGHVRLAGWDREDCVELAVIDTGIGVPVEERERIFERFYQVDSSARRRYKGTGLGLTICKHIVNQHGGQIWVEDGDVCPGAGNEQRGSAFHFMLPKLFPNAESGAMSLNFAEFSRN